MIASHYKTRVGIEVEIKKHYVGPEGKHYFLCQTIEKTPRIFSVEANTLDCDDNHALDLVEQLPDEAGGPLVFRKERKEKIK